MLDEKISDCNSRQSELCYIIYFDRMYGVKDVKCKKAQYFQMKREKKNLIF